MPRLIKQTSKYGFVSCVFYNPDTNLVANNLIFTLKRDLDVDLINFFVDMMVKNLKSLAKRHGLNLSEYTVTYVTRRKAGKRKYGFDHTRYLAKTVAKKLGIECQKALLNVGETEQKSLTKVERLENAKISYKINEKADIRGRKYLLIDDIITSGATMKACADVLRENGAEEIIPVSFAKNN
jgi:competence protein ComFC